MSNDETTSSRPSARSSQSMEAAITQMQKMRADMVSALADVGPARWGLARNQQPSISRASCDDGDGSEAEQATLPNWESQGNYPQESWRETVATVEKVGRTYDFTQVETVLNRPDHLQIDGRRPADDAHYIFDMDTTNAGLLVATGCHHWKNRPEGQPPDTTSQ